MDLKQFIIDIPDFPTEGIMFRDITPLLQNYEAFKEAVKLMADYAKDRGAELIAGPEARGFLFACPLALEIGAGFAPVRKPGKLPRETISCKYDLEYGSNEVFMHADAVKPGQKVLIVDDLLATGGTGLAACKLVEQLGGEVVGMCYLIELDALNGRELLKDYDVHSILHY